MGVKDVQGDLPKKPVVVQESKTHLDYLLIHLETGLLLQRGRLEVLMAPVLQNQLPHQETPPHKLTESQEVRVPLEALTRLGPISVRIICHLGL